MLISANYICPVKGLTGLEPPEPIQLGKAVGVAKSLGLARLTMPVLEESLMGTSRAKVGFLDGLIHALDQVAEAGLTAWLIAPAQRVLGLDWVPSHLVGSVQDPKADPVFMGGRIRKLRSFHWWETPSIIQKRISLFSELVAACSGHPCLTGWLILDRFLEWARPDLQVADLVLKSFIAEIRERDESGSICISLGWSELLYPEMAQSLASQVDGIRIGGCENQPPGIVKQVGLAGELTMAAYLGTLARWLIGQPVEIEIGWGVLNTIGETEENREGFKRLAYQGLAGANWVSLIDPEPRLYSHPPWALRHGLERIGLIDHGLEPKEQVEAWFKETVSIEPKDEINDFIDISRDEYLDDPRTHLPRLWDHFQETL
jgi:hypothetical protein